LDYSCYNSWAGKQEPAFMNPQKKLLSAHEAARRLGLSLSRIYDRRDLRSRQRLKGRRVVFDAEKVDAALADTQLRTGPWTSRPRSGPPRPTPVDRERGEAAARIFAAIREGRTLVQVVEELQYTPDFVREMAAQYAELSGGVGLSPAEIGVLRECSYALRWAMDRGKKPLCQALRDVLEQSIPPCRRCGGQHAEYCRACLTVRHPVQ
jgi:predicted DNA-binding transcriptional regulator AlpA